MKVKPKSVVSQKIHGVAESHCRTLLKTRDLIDVSDEPLERGGTNEGFAPTEFMLAGLVACTNVILHRIAAILPGLEGHLPVRNDYHRGVDRHAPLETAK